MGKLPQRSGKWAGIALATPDGDNDGKIGEETYFLYVFFSQKIKIVPKTGAVTHDSYPHVQQCDGDAFCISLIEVFLAIWSVL